MSYIIWACILARICLDLPSHCQNHYLAALWDLASRISFPLLTKVIVVYYRWTTFLQLNTITFLLPFPNPFIHSELSGSRRNDFNSMYAFLFEDIPPIIHCNRPQKVLHLPFCNLPNCWTAKFKVQPCITKRGHARFGTYRDTTKIRRVLWAEIEIVVALLFPPRRSRSTSNFVLISLRTRI